ncbi:MAG: hypothetical protein RLZZ252_161 [Bacteroidota bacterium]|jgi:ring-1,2-phenylacetyl-CoA epoxidase subunit PaaB
MIVKSIDPRINRASLDDERTDGVQQPMDQLETYEVFQQIKRGTHHQHVGTVHASNEEMAMIFAKEQFCRRGKAVNLWIVRSENIFATDYEDADIFETTTSKTYREPEAYKVMDRIQAYKERTNA